MASPEPLHALSAGMPIVFDGNRITRVSPELAAAFAPGDSLLVVQRSGELLHVPAATRALVERCVTSALGAFEQLNALPDSAIARFFDEFAARLADDALWSKVREANTRDVESAERRGRSTTRLVASDAMRRGMIEGLRGWSQAQSRRGEVLEQVEHDGFRVELLGAALGVVGFVFEGRPNVLADATGVLRSGNAVVFRIGSDALGTAQALMEHTLRPSLTAAGLPEASVVLVPSAEHAAGWALFSDARLGLAVARGSGPAVATLGALAQQAGVPVSLHGTGGAWLVAAESADARQLEDIVYASLDRKVCNTLNVACIVRSQAAQLVPAFLRGLERAGAQQAGFKLHVVEGSEAAVPAALFETQVAVQRAEGPVRELQAERLPLHELGREWEWEKTPEVSLLLVDDVAQAVALFNRYSPRFVGSLVSQDRDEHARFFARIDAPFVGDALTRWVDGQYALRKPELGLSNWQYGRLFGRGGILSGDTVYTVRTRYSSK
ncbi:MAG: aldehyde dehydrogenase family protein [Polyangiales bacterium]